MTISMNHLAVLIGSFVLCGCALSTHVAAKEVDEKRPSFCEVAENLEKYRGAKLELSARYVSDGKHEEVLEDLTCSHGRRIIDIGRHGGSGSVERFYAERKKICSELSASYLCNISAKVAVLGAINVISGEFVLDIEEVRRFAFDNGTRDN